MKVTEEKAIRLSQLPAGTKAIIKSHEESDFQLTLMEMGCIPGELIIVEQIAPLGDPISISVAGYQLSLRINEADSIFIAPKSA